MSNLLKDADGNDSSKRWFGAACFAVSVGLAVLSVFKGSVDVQLVSIFLINATIALVGGTAAEQISKIGGGQ